VKKGDLLFGSIRPYLRKAGIATYDGAVTGTVHCFEIKDSFDFNFALMTITSENFFEYAINNSKGTKMPVVSSESLLNFQIPYNDKISKIFNRIPIKDIIISNVIQSNELSELRDFLLPLLMNGQVTFK
jgi:type I restriction enzyme S subunit